MEASWHQHRSKIDVNFEKRFFEKTFFSIGKTVILRVQGVEVGSPNRSKINQKLKPKMDCLLASILVDFCRFWIDFGSLFWLIFEGQLVRKGNQNDERCQGQNSLPKERPGRRVRLRTPPPLAPHPVPPGVGRDFSISDCPGGG